MQRLPIILCAVALMATATGCHHRWNRCGCSPCGPCGVAGGGYGGAYGGGVYGSVEGYGTPTYGTIPGAYYTPYSTAQTTSSYGTPVMATSPTPISASAMPTTPQVGFPTLATGSVDPLPTY